MRKDKSSRFPYLVSTTTVANTAALTIHVADFAHGHKTAYLFIQNPDNPMPDSNDPLRNRLTEEQYEVTCNGSTEPPFDNLYWDHRKPGIYVDVISGVPLFSSSAKFDSGTGWPSFYEPLNPDEIVEIVDTTYGMRRVEVRSKTGNAHLGHVFPDGPPPTGLRYCINSASLRFVPTSEPTGK